MVVGTVAITYGVLAHIYARRPGKESPTHTSTKGFRIGTIVLGVFLFLLGFYLRRKGAFPAPRGFCYSEGHRLTIRTNER